MHSFREGGYCGYFSSSAAEATTAFSSLKSRHLPLAQLENSHGKLNALTKNTAICARVTESPGQ